ncbi:hypothetical protein HKD37_16G045029 [Glycine soja]
MYPPLFSLNNLVDVPSTRTDPQEMYPLLFSVTKIQVDVPSTCTTKDVPSNVLRQSSQAVSPSTLCEGGNKRILRQIKRILRLCRFEFFDKGEGRHKKNSGGMYPPLFSLNNLVDVPSTRTDPQDMYPLLFLVTTAQVDVPSTCTTKDVPSNAISPSKLCEGGNKTILRREESKEFSDCVILNSLTRETQKEFRRLVLGEFFLAKGEGNEKDE